MLLGAFILLLDLLALSLFHDFVEYVEIAKPALPTRAAT